MPDIQPTPEREAAEHRCPCGDLTHRTALSAAYCCDEPEE